MMALMASSMIQPVASSLTNAISEQAVITAGKGQENGFLLLLTLPLMIKTVSKRSHRNRKRI